MYKYDDPTAVAVMPAFPAAGTPGFFTDGDLGTGVPATILRAWFLNQLMSELLNLVQGAGLTTSRTTFNQLLSAVQMMGGVFGIAGGTANALTIAPTTPVALYAGGLEISVAITIVNTGAVTISASGLGAKAIIKPDGTALTGGELQPGWIATLRYNGTAFVFTNAPISTAPAAGDTSNRNATTAWAAQNADTTVRQAIVWGVAGGTANALSLTPAKPLAAYAAGVKLMVLITAANTGVANINVSALGARTIINPDGSALMAGELPVGSIAEFVYDGSWFVYTNAPVTPTPLAGDSSTRIPTTAWTMDRIIAAVTASSRNSTTRLFNFNTNS